MRVITRIAISAALFAVVTGVCSGMASALENTAVWKDHTIYQLNSTGLPMKQQASTLTPSETWPGRTQLPFLVYMPDKGRILLYVNRILGEMSGNLLSYSDDGGQTWTKPYYMADANGDASGEGSMGIAYLGGGKLLSSNSGVRFSSDYGLTWTGATPLPKTSDGGDLWPWYPFMVDRDPQTGKVTRLVDTRYRDVGAWGVEPFDCQPAIRFSEDEGKTWSKELEVPQWRGINENVTVRAKNGDIVAILRTNMRGRYRQLWHDNYCGIAVSVSKDNGYTWSKPNQLFEWGRMHGSPVLMPNGDIVVSYLNRRGYPNTPDGGHPQYGLEAIVSHDNGQTWDLDHRYILFQWVGPYSARDTFCDMAAGCNVSSIVLPGGTILTVVGAGKRLDPTRRDITPTDITIIRWKPNPDPVSKANKIASAPSDSDLRNKLDINKFIKFTPPATRKNIALLSEGAKVTSSPSSVSPEFILHDPYVYPVAVSFTTRPAWVEVQWDKPRRIDRVDIYAGDPSGADNPSSECVPLDYRLQRRVDSHWVDIVPPVFNASRYLDFLKTHTRADDFLYRHDFAPITTTAIRLYMTKTTDTGKRITSPDKPVVAPKDRVTIIRSLEVFAAK